MISTTTADGVRLAGRWWEPRFVKHLNEFSRNRFQDPVGPATPTYVVAHGFTGSTSTRRVLDICERLAAGGAGVVAFDFRGHGESGGGSTLGDVETADIAAAVAWARARTPGPLVVAGWSMGGSIVLRHAGLGGDADAVVSVSSPGLWYERRTRAMRIVHHAAETRHGRALCRLATGTRLTAGWERLPESPVEVVAAIAPRPLLVVHGDADGYFPLRHGTALAGRRSARRVLAGAGDGARRDRDHPGARRPDRRLGAGRGRRGTPTGRGRRARSCHHDGMSDDAQRDTDVAVADAEGTAAPTATGGVTDDDPTIPTAGRGRTDTTGLLVTAIVAALAGLGLWMAARSSTGTLVVGVAITQGLLILAWIVGLRVPGKWGGLAVAVVAAVASDVLAVQFPADQLGVLVPPLGLLVLAIFVVQLLRGVVRVRVVESVSDVAVLGIAVVALASLIVLQHRILDPSTASPTAAVPVVLVIGAALALGALGDLLAPVPRFDPSVERGLFGVLLAGAAGGVAGWAVLHDAFGFGPQRGAFLGAALGVVVGLIAVGSSFIRHEVSVPAAADAGPAADPADDATDAEPGGRRSLDDLAAEEVLVEVDARTESTSAWPARLQPVAATLWAFSIAAPVGYLLTVALGG